MGTREDNILNGAMRGAGDMPSDPADPHSWTVRGDHNYMHGKYVFHVMWTCAACDTEVYLYCNVSPSSLGDERTGERIARAFAEGADGARKSVMESCSEHRLAKDVMES